MAPTWTFAIWIGLLFMPSSKGTYRRRGLIADLGVEYGHQYPTDLNMHPEQQAGLRWKSLHYMRSALQLKALASDSPVTFVTALYDIGRGQLDRSMDQYKGWMSKTLAIRNPFVAFMQTQDMCDWVLKQRVGTLTLCIVQPLEEIPKYDMRFTLALLKKQHWFVSTQKDTFAVRLPNYLPVIYSKFSWVSTVAHANPFSSSYFFWIDAGAGRWTSAIEGKPWPDLTKLYASVPDMKNVSNPKIIMQRSIKFPSQPMTNMTQLLAGQDKDFMMAGFWGGTAAGIHTLAHDAEAFVQKMTEMGLLANEQAFLYAEALEKPELCFHMAERCPPQGCRANPNSLPILEWFMTGGD